MKRCCCLALAVLLPGTLLAARAETRPARSREPAKPATSTQAAAPARAPVALDVNDEPDPEVNTTADPLPPDLEKPTAEELAATQPKVPPISEKDLAAYFAERPKTYLIDPQGLLDPRTARDQSDFLKGHAADAAIDLFIYVFKRDQEIPGDVRKEEVTERFFASGRPAVIVYYHLGAPQQAEMYLSPSLTDVVPVAERRRTLEGAVRQAAEKPGPQEQLLAFSSHLASRIYWMERVLAEAESGDDHDAKAAQARAAKLAKKPLSLGERVARWRPLAEELAVPGLLLASMLAAVTGLLVWLRWRATYQFPRFAVEPRLGGEHTAGAGAIISFASPNLPPAAQCEQVAEGVRRW